MVHPEACVLLMRSHKGFRQAQVRSSFITGCKAQPSLADINRQRPSECRLARKPCGMHGAVSTSA
ncbi:hypothetical protein, partial [Xanthomonas euvesicatoria]|uniref:hypothetical protein n=1 Tax=Xanthomonas euvesicatoria TaxID=456327 RepID=UPI001C201D5B